MKTLSPLAKSSAQSRSEPRGPFFQRHSQPGSNFFAPVLQAKLEVSQPGDPHEVEADRMADYVMGTLGEPFFAPASPAPSAAAPAINRVWILPATETADEQTVAKEDEQAPDSILRMADPWFSDGAGDDENTAASPPIQRRAVGPSGHLAPSVPHRYRISRRDPSLIPARALYQPGQLFRPVGLAAPPYAPGRTEPAARHEAKSVSPLFSVNQKDAVSRSRKSLAPKWSLPLAQISE